VSYASLSANKSNGSWFSVDIRRTVDDWVHRPESNHGLQVEAYDSTGNPLFITDMDDENVGYLFRWLLSSLPVVWFVVKFGNYCRGLITTRMKFTIFIHFSSNLCIFPVISRVNSDHL
jgi:hypothetical protein